MTSDELDEFAQRYAKAWCSQNPESVAAFFAENASLTVNGGPPTPALEIASARFMRDFPDMIVTFDKLEPRGDRTAFHWTLTGTYRTGEQEIMFGSAATNCGRLTMPG